MRISIGILAHNEEANIGDTLRDLFGQSLLVDAKDTGHTIEVVCVPNGCSDRTALVAAEVLAECNSSLTSPASVSVSIHDLAEPGKSRTWNRFVHEFSDQSADVVFLLDADIRLPQRECLTLMLDQLVSDSLAWACVDVPRKDIAFAKRKSLLARASLAASDQRLAGKPAIAGSLYCVRGEIIRQIWMPEDLLVEDGFVKAMLVTEFFTRDGADERLVRAERAYHVFEAERGLGSIFRHQLRLTLGVAVNSILYAHLWSVGARCHAGEYVRDRNASNPKWTSELVSNWIAARRFWPISPKILVAPLRQLACMRFHNAVRHAPSAVMRFVLSIPVFFTANRQLRLGRFDW